MFTVEIRIWIDSMQRWADPVVAGIGPKLNFVYTINDQRAWFDLRVGDNHRHYVIIARETENSTEHKRAARVYKSTFYLGSEPERSCVAAIENASTSNGRIRCSTLLNWSLGRARKRNKNVEGMLRVIPSRRRNSWMRIDWTKDKKYCIWSSNAFDCSVALSARVEDRNSAQYLHWLYPHEVNMNLRKRRNRWRTTHSSGSELPEVLKSKRF